MERLAIPLLLLCAAFASSAGGGTWVQRTQQMPRPTGFPAAYTWDPYSMPMVYDERRQVTVGFGGYTNPPLIYLPVSEFNGTDWVSRSADLAAHSPPDRSPGALVYDSIRGVTVMLGGFKNPYSFREIWEYNGSGFTQRTWTGAEPAKMNGFKACFDPHRGRIVCLAESATHAANTYETWEWTGTAWDRGPDLVLIDPTSAEIVFDIARNKAFVYGRGTSGIWQQAWEYTPGATAAQGSWEYLVSTGDTFEGRLEPAVVYHPRLQKIFRIGGRAAGNLYSFLPDVWVWDFNRKRWVEMGNDFLPMSASRAAAAVCYDHRRGVIQVYGGLRKTLDGNVGSSTYLYDMWEWSDANPPDTWVDFGNQGSQNGSSANPWGTLTTALYQAPVGGVIFLRPGSSAETLDSTTLRVMPVMLRAQNGPVLIGRAP